MIGFDIGDDRNHRLQMQKRRIAFVGLSYQKATFAQACVSAGTV